MNKCRDKPDRKTRAKYNPQRQPLMKTQKSHKEKQDGRHNTPQSAFSVLGHQAEIAGIIQIQPDKHDKAGQRHHGNQTRQRRQPAPYLRAQSNNAQTNQKFDSKSHTDRSPLSARKAKIIRLRHKAASYLALGFTEGSSFNEPDSQRIAIVMPVVGLNRRNQQKDQVKNRYSRRQDKADAHKTQKPRNNPIYQH